MQPPSPNDPLTFRRFIIAGLGVVAAILAGIQIPDQPYLAVAALGGFAYLFTLAVNYRWLAVLMVALQPAALIVPFFPGRPYMWEVCALLSWPSLLVSYLVNRRRLPELRFDRFETAALLSLVGYVVVLICLMLSRGVGFRVLGGGQMGGRFYVQQVILSVVPILLLTASPGPRALLAAVAAGWVLSLTYLISDFALALGGPRFYSALQFFELPTDAINFYIGYELTGVRRYQSLWFVGSALISAVCTLIPLKDVIGRRSLIGVPLLTLGFVLGLGSGHRTVLVQTMTSLFVLAAFQRFWTPLRAVLAGGLLTVAVGILYVTAPDMPLSLQRSVSFLPGINVSALAKDDATATITDRVEVLKMAAADIPKYWLIGRGFGMERFDRFQPDEGVDGIYQQYANGLFYNGLLGSFLKTGLPGLICSLLFILWVSRMAIEMVGTIRLKLAAEWSRVERLGLFISAQWFSLVAFFYILHGDSGVWMQVFGLPAALILICRRHVQGRSEHQTTGDAATP